MTRLFPLPHRAQWVRLLAFLAGLAVAARVVAGVHAQDTGPSLAITAVESESFPSVTAHLTVTGANGLPLVGLSATDFTVLEDGVAVPAGDVVLDSDTSQALTLVLAVDLAMPGEELLAVQSALRNFTDGLSANDQVALLTFNDEVVEAQTFTSDRLALATAIGRLTPSGSATLFNQAADHAVTLLSGLPAGRKAVLLFTDSGDTANTLSPEPIINKADAAGVALYPFGHGTRFNETILDNWARFTGGQAYLLATPAEIQANLQTLGVLLRQSYSITYTSGVTADNARHDLSIELDYQDQTAAAESRFIAVPGAVTIEGLTIGNGQTLRGMVFLIAEVAAPAPVESVTFSLDGETLVELTSPPYRFDWDTATAGAGTHAVTVVARDSAGNVGETQVSVNVAVPAPVAATAAPVPTAVPSESPVIGFARSALNIGRIVLSAAVLLAAFIITLLLWLRARQAQQPEAVTDCHLELVNRGNARTQYELRAEDPAKLMKFQFLLNDTSLATRQAAVTPAAMAPAAALAPVGATNGKAKRAQNESKAKGIQQPKVIKQAQGAAFKGIGLAARLSGWVMAVTYLLPGNQSIKMRSQAARFRGDIDVVDDAAKAPDRYRHIIDDVVPVDKINEKFGGKDKATRTQAAAPAAQPMTAVATVPAMAGTNMVGTAPGMPPAAAGAAVPQQPVLKQIAANTAGWALTPYIEPGSTLKIKLFIVPLRVPKSQSYGFRVLSRAADSSDKHKLTQIEHGSVVLTAVPWHKQLWPWLLFVIMLGALGLLVWYLLSTFGVLGVG